MHSIILNSFILLNNCSYGYWDNIGKKCTNVCGNGYWNQNIQNCICDFGWSQNILNIDNYTKNKLYENPKFYLECTYYNECNHGIWDINKKKCICYKNWRNYNIFDIISKEIYNDTKCEQFNCVSDNQCKKLLYNNEAKCIIKHQDCYCGLKYALKNKWMGYKNNNASCMSLLYIINFKLIFIIEYILLYGWYYTLCLSTIFIIFGQIRIRCPHNNKSIFNLLYYRIKDPCQCIYNKKKCNITDICDNFAWSIYIIELSIWLHMFILSIYFILLSWWLYMLSFIIFMLLISYIIVKYSFIVIIYMFSVLFKLMCCNEQCIENNINQCSITYNIYNLYCCKIFCCDCNFNNINNINIDLNVLTYIFYPFLFILSLYPKCPDNLWGGLFGMIIGTHKYCNLFYKYNQNNKCWFYECLALHKYDNILYNDDDFRNLISNFIESEQKYKPIEQII
jgi:hypothetical protein